MALTEDEIVLPGSTDKERVLKDSATGRKMEVVALTDPVTGAVIVPGSEATLQAILAAIQGGGVITIYQDITPGAAVPDPPASGYREFWVDSGVTPNRRIYHGLILANGTEIPIYDVMV